MAVGEDKLIGVYGISARHFESGQSSPVVIGYFDRLWLDLENRPSALLLNSRFHFDVKIRFDTHGFFAVDERIKGSRLF